MKRFSLDVRPTPNSLLVVALFLLCAGAAFAQHAKVTLKDGHISPVMARGTYPDGKTQDVMIVGHFWGGSHQYQGANDSGGVVNLWLDTLSTIADPNDDGVTATLKSGTERHLEWHGSTQTFQVANEDGATEDIDVRKVKKIEFLKPPRRNKQGNAMFPNWIYSPFTGEKLPGE